MRADVHQINSSWLRWRRETIAARNDACGAPVCDRLWRVPATAHVRLLVRFVLCWYAFRLSRLQAGAPSLQFPVAAVV